ncbi:NAD(P)-binding domain-containing protein [Acidovorax sp. SUPP3434]|uniref:flavin-containing monooxygenase n=1 Tax=Acidovorax sp. SUPP3434 TaxID=2920880 RepID=UPI0023DE4E89|nr:NAD(P)-binding domain-containing protein [Acidovorax sp. SUPP3434]GKS99365.1 NAD(P)-binding domain-containing protein [Acidovorax sp. SUPP3434]
MTNLSQSKLADRSAAVCVIGAGPGGLSAARALKMQGLDYDQFERHSDLGGLWDTTNPGSPVYASTHFISSRDLSGFIGYPMPRDYPDYPSHRQILAYLRSFADAFGLREKIQFNTGVQRIRKDSASRWVVELADGTHRLYGAVVCATGVNWDPSMPSFEGAFQGEVRHAATFKHGDEFRGRRVLVVGAGNSGADIACEAAAHAQRAFISVRRGYHFIPKHLMGVPVDQIAEAGPHLPMWLARPLFSGLLRLIQGDLTRLGLPKPDHRLFESHPLLNSQLLHHLQHGNIAIKPDIARLDGGHVVFKDGSREEIDLVLCATGYRWSCSYATEFFTWTAGRPQIYLSMFNRSHRNLFGIGYLETNSSAYKLFDTQAHMIACYLKAQRTAPESAQRFDDAIRKDEPDLSGGIRFVQSPRHAVYIDAHAFKAYLRKLRRRMGWGELSETMYDALRVKASPVRHSGRNGLAAAPQPGEVAHG